MRHQRHCNCLWPREDCRLDDRV